MHIKCIIVSKLKTVIDNTRFLYAFIIQLEINFSFNHIFQINYIYKSYIFMFSYSFMNNSTLMSEARVFFY
jgi:hypothetical protein